MPSTEIAQYDLPDASNGGLILGDDAGQYIDKQIAGGWSDLELWERAFAHRYLANGTDHREAATYVNRAKSAGVSILRRPLLREFIKYLQDEQRSVSLITNAFIEANYLHVIECAKGHKKVAMVNSDGQSFTAKQYNAQALLSANKELANHIGYSKVEKPTESKVTVVVDMGALTGRTPVIIDHE